MRAIGDDRWPTARFLDVRHRQPGKTYTFAAGTIDHVWDFDQSVFGISPREALQLDPQQRLALQLVWEALEDALIPASSISQQNVGVYAGASSLDYSTTRMFDAASADAYFMIGNTLSLVSNRVSHAFDLRGPSLTIDTACSSSLVALHHAVQALDAGQIEMAIVLGVNLLLSPFPFIGFAQASMLSPAGLCRSFDAKADGYVRAEGGVALVLCRSDQSIVATPRNYGCIAGTGMNSDGRTVGVSLPSADGQAALLEDVYRRAGLDPDLLAFAEAHGTGTRVGDPIEAHALGEVLGRKRSRPLPIGSVKSNIGHLEPASGLAGLLKAMLALEHDLLPPTLHVDEPNPDIPFDDLNLAIARKALPIERSGKMRAAAVSSFGFGGTNAHVILADAHEPPRRSERRNARRNPAMPAIEAPAKPGLLVLTAANEGALRALARAHLEHLDAGNLDPAGIAAAAGHFRDLMPERAALTSTEADAVSGALRALAEGEQNPAFVRGSAVAREAKVAFVFSGNGSQWAGMGIAAHAANACFRAKLDEIDRIFARHADWSLADALNADDLDKRIERASVAQPLLFAIQVAIVAALADMGIEPDMILGHSVGEIAAAHAAGTLSLEAAVAVIVARSACQESSRGLGTMAALRLGEEAATASIARSGIAGIEVAAVNSPRSVTLVGTRPALSAYATHAAREGAGCKVLDLDYPFHSRLMASAQAPLLTALKGLKATAGGIPFISTVTGAVLAGQKLGRHYWWRNVRDPVRFGAAVAAARAHGAQVFIEIGPRPILQGYLGECFAEPGPKAVGIPTLEAGGRSDGDPIRKAAAHAIVRGARVRRDVAFGPRPAGPIRLPAYPWQNTTYRPPATPEAFGGLASPQTYHPLLGWQGVERDPCWHVHIDPDNLPWLQDHRVNGQVVFPGAGFAEMALAAARRWLGEDAVEIRDMAILQPLVLRAGESCEVRILISPDSAAVEIASRPRLSDQAFAVHAFCRLAKLPSSGMDLEIREGESGRVLAGEAVYKAARSFGLDYGPAFRRVACAKRAGPRVLITFGALPTGEEPASPLGLHPADLDGAFHGLFVAAADRIEGRPGVPLVPVRIGRLRLHRAGRRAQRAELLIRRLGPRSAQADVLLLDADGAPIVSVEDVRFTAMRLVSEPKIAEYAYHEVLDPVGTAEARAEGPSLRKLLDICLAESLRSSPEAEATDEPRLLLEAAARRIAHDAAAQFARGDGTLDLDKSVGSAQAALLRRMLLALETGGLAGETETGWKLDECRLPAAADLCRTVLAEHPAWSADCVLLNRAAIRIESLLSQAGPADGGPPYSAATLDHFRAASPRFAAVQDLAGIVARLCELHRSNRRLRICVVGLQDGLARRIVDAVDPERCRLVLTDSDRRQLERARLRYAGHVRLEVLDLPAAFGAGTARPSYDLVVSAFGLSRVLFERDCLGDLAAAVAPDGVLLALEATPDTFHEVVLGIEAALSGDTIATQFPVPVLRHAAEWSSALARAGLVDPAAVPLGESGCDTLLVAGGAVDRASKAVPVEDGSRAGARVELICTTARSSATFAKHFAKELSARGLTLDVPSRGHNGNGAAKRTNGDGRGRKTLNGKGVANGFHGGDLATIKLSVPYELVWYVPLASHAAQDGTFLGGCVAMLARLLEERNGKARRLWIVLAEGAGPDEGFDTAATDRDGLRCAVRTAINEYSDLDIRLLDFEGVLPPSEVSRRVAALIADPPQDRELVVAANGMFASRVRRGLPQVKGSESGGGADGARVVLEQQDRGSLESLRWERMPCPEPKPGEVSIEVVAAGLNFRDVMWGLGLLPEEALEAGFAGPTLGFECSGVIRAVGSAVSGLQPGTPVLALAPQAFASHVTVPVHAVVPLPENVSVEAAASIPVAFLTAYFALHHLAHLDAGEWVLIHGGAGGVGLAALQIARWRGAKVIATAGTEEKRDILRLLGAEHVLSSRSLEFADQVRSIADGGVDVVLNSLSGEAMERSLELVKPFGRFLELGKRDFYANTKVGLRPFRNNVSYFGIDADQLLGQQPMLAARLMRELMQHFADETFTPLAYRAFDAGEVIDAFRLMQQSGHIGKIVVRPPRPMSLPASPRNRAFAANGEGAHVIIGGLGGFGLATADWLADRGARTIVLVGRSDPSEHARAAIGALRGRGADVRVERCDAADAGALERLLSGLRAEMPIKGVVHAAMVLDDALMRNLSEVRIAPVLRAKIGIGHNLDRLTRSDSLDYFWLYSSVSALIGNPGQSAYVAGNAALEGLARMRRSAGRPATAIRWGAIEDAGILARDESRMADLVHQAGSAGLKARDALDLLGNVLSGDDGSVERAVVTLAAMNWSDARAQLPLLRTTLFGDLRGIADPPPVSGVDLKRAIAGLDEGGAREIVARHLAAELSAILRMPADDLNWHRPLADLGLDSLMAVELRLAATRRLGIELPLASIADGATLASIADSVVGRLRSLHAPGDTRLAADRELAEKHVSAVLDGDQFARVSREVGERAAVSNRIIP